MVFWYGIDKPCINLDTISPGVAGRKVNSELLIVNY